jgi:hypothetical protein
MNTENHSRQSPFRGFWRRTGLVGRIIVGRIMGEGQESRAAVWMILPPMILPSMTRESFSSSSFVLVLDFHPLRRQPAA